MSGSKVSVVRRTGQVLTGIGALVVLIGLLGGAPIALLAFAGNPLPDHLPGLDELGRVLTSRDDGQLFVRALALVGWAGWATFALSVLVELPARAMRRPALRLPGLGRQQRAAAALVGSIALILSTSPAATAATVAVAGPPAATAPYAPSRDAPAVSFQNGPAVTSQNAPAVSSENAPAASSLAVPPVGGVVNTAQAPRWLAGPDPADEPEPVYRVEEGDYLGHIAGRYLGDFDAYPRLARLNNIHNPDLIRPGQLLHLPPEAADHGVRAHATGLVAMPPPPNGWAGPPPAPADPPASGSEFPAAPDSAPDVPAQPASDGRFTVAVGASRAGTVDGLNRPLAISAVLSLASIVGAQIGAALGRRRVPAGRRSDNGRHRNRH